MKIIQCTRYQHKSEMNSTPAIGTENKDTEVFKTTNESNEHSIFDELKEIKQLNELQEIQEFQHVIIEYSHEITKRLEIEKRYEFDLLKLKLDHELDMFELKMKYENIHMKKTNKFSMKIYHYLS